MMAVRYWTILTGPVREESENKESETGILGAHCGNNAVKIISAQNICKRTLNLARRIFKAKEAYLTNTNIFHREITCLKVIIQNTSPVKQIR